VSKVAEKENVASKLLAKHAPKPPTRCQGCREPHAEKLHVLLDHAIESQEVITAEQIHGALKEFSGYPMTSSALERHLKQHDAERWNRVNVARRGPIE